MEKLLHPDADTWPDSLADFASKTVVMGDDYDSRDDLWKSYQLCMAAIRERMAARRSQLDAKGSQR
jgi:hypothetical protein